MHQYVFHAFDIVPERARLAKTLPGWAWALLSLPIFAVIFMLAAQCAKLIYALGRALGFENTPYQDVVGLLAFIGFFVAVLFWVRFVENRPLKTMGWTGEKALWRYAKGFILGIAYVGISVCVIALLGGYDLKSWFPGSGSNTALIFAGLFMLGFMVQGAGEELISRGWFLSSVSARAGLGIAIALNAVIFAALHMGNTEVINWIAIFNLMLFGVFASFYALAERSLAGVCGVHSAWNWFLGTALGLEVSGWEYPSTPWLVDLDPAGHDLITGGAFGPEGSLVVTAVLGSLSVWAFFKYKQRPLITSSAAGDTFG